MEKEKHEMKLMDRMRRNLEKEDTRLEIASCEKDNSFHA